MRAADGVPFEFGTITVSDGISMGTEGMKTSLVSREVIADSIELVTFGERMDGLITIAGCDKNMPGCMMALARLNVPGIFMYGGSIMPGQWNGRDVNIQDVFEAVGGYAKGDITFEELRDLECRACPGEGSCAGLFTANTMSTAIEVMGMSLPATPQSPPSTPASWARPAMWPHPDAPARRGRPPSRHHDKAGLRERHHRGRRHGRLHQYRPPPARHSQRGRGAPGALRTSSASALALPTSPI